MSINTARNSDIDRTLIESSEEAEAIISQYVNPANDYAPHDLWPMQPQAEAWAMADPRFDHTKPSDVRRKLRNIQKGIKELCVDPNTRLEPTDSVVLRLTESELPDYLDPDSPRIRFANMLSTNRSYIADHREAVAVYFDPKMVGVKWKSTRHGEHMVPDQFDAAGYTHIVRWFGSEVAAKQAAESLQRAIVLTRRDNTDSAIEEDPIRMLDVMEERQIQREEYGF